LREWRETEGEAEFDERETFVGGGEGATKAGFELAGFDPDEIGGFVGGTAAVLPSVLRER